MVAAACVQAATFVTRPMVSYRAIEIGTGNAGIGLVAASFAVLPLAVAVPVGRWVDASGERRAGLLGALLLAGSAAATAWARSLWTLIPLNALFGLGHLLAVVGQQALIANRVADAGHDRAYGRFTVFTSLGQLAGPASAALVAGGGPAGSGAAGIGGAAGTGAGLTRALLVGSVFALVAGVATAWISGSKAPRAGTAAPARVVETLRAPGMWQALVTSMSTLAAIDLVVAYLPAWGEEQGVSVAVVGWLLALRAAASMASRLGMDRLIRMFGRRPLLATNTAVAAAGFAVLPFCDMAAATVVVAVTGFTLGIGQPLTMSWVASRAASGQRGTALALRLTGNRLGQVAVPAIAGTLAGLASVSGVFVLSAGMLAATAALAGQAPESTIE
jgi:MFS family permease